MDIERGNIEILFQKIPYMYLLAPKDCSESFLGYNKVDEGLYMMFSPVLPMMNAEIITNICVNR